MSSPDSAALGAALALTEEESAVVAAARQFAEEVVRPSVLTWERHGRLPKEAVDAAAGAGLLGIQVPGADGGTGAGFVCKMRAAEAIAEVSMATAFSLVNLHNSTAKLAHDASPEASAEFVPEMLAGRRFGATALTEPGAGSDFAAIETSAARVDGGWVLNGAKAWITNAAFADVFVCYAQTDVAKGWRGIACFVIDATRPGFNRSAPVDMFGARSVGAGGFELQDYHAPDAHLIHPPGEAFKRALGSINGARTYVAAMACAVLRASLMRVTDYLSERSAFGGPLLRQQGLRWQLADIATELEAATLMTDKAAALVQLDHADAVLAASHAKKYAARVASARLLDCIQMLGANGMQVDEMLGHHLACAKMAGYVDGSSEIQNERIAALLFASPG
ncbi:MAG: acyl-CoA dehydrogenase family protein [Pseudomonadota bacterium]